MGLVTRSWLRVLKQVEKWVDLLHQRLPGKQFLIVSAVFVGTSTGLAAVCLKLLVHYIRLAVELQANTAWLGISYVALPLIGLLLCTWYLKRFVKGKLMRGASSILYSIVRKSSFLPRDHMYAHVFSSAITVGFGGSAGLESPIVSTGSAIGSNFAKTYRIPYRERTLLLASGAAAGIGATFNAPIAGVLFALEVLLNDITITAFIPLLIAAASGALISGFLMDEDVLLAFDLIQPLSFSEVPAFVGLGVLCGLVSVYYTRVFLWSERWVVATKLNVWVKAVFGGIVLGTLILFFPPLFGEGYQAIRDMASLQGEKLFANSPFAPYLNSGYLMLVFAILIMLVKPVATGITIGSGGNGGNFAPSLVMGALAGFVFSQLLYMLGWTSLQTSNFVLVGMAGILTGMFHAPLTGIFLIAEITGGYDLMIPLMLVSAISFAVVKYFAPMSIEMEKLKEMGERLPTDKDAALLSSLKTSNFIDTGNTIVEPHMSLRFLVNCIRTTAHDTFPVVKDKKMLGLIVVDDIRDLLFDPAQYDKVMVRDLMQKTPVLVMLDDPMDVVMQKFEQSGRPLLPVISRGEFLGFIYKQHVLEQYRDVLRKNSLS